MVGISRHYVSVDGRLVHYRKAGTGPLLLLLHQSPQSSLDYVELMGRWASRFTMIAPDRPGCGQSDPLPDAAPGFDRYGDATAAFLDAIGIRRVPVYGFHTGASEALSLAARHPQRVVAVAANGVAAVTPAELAEIDRDYLPLLEPSWDGAHLAWLWARMREQTVFFPWFKRTRAARMAYDMAPPVRTQRFVLELLRAWRTYHVAYRAAFHFDGVAALRHSSAPTMVAAAGADPLREHLARLGAPRAGLEIRAFETAAELEAAAADFLAAHAGHAGHAPAGAPAASHAPSAERRQRTATTRRFVGPPGAALHVAFDGPREGERLIVLHDAGERAASIAPLVGALSASGFNVMAPDLPGHGESAPLARGEPWPVDATADRIAEEFAGAPVTLLGLGASAAVALAAAQSGRMSVNRVIVWQPSAWPLGQHAEIVGAFAATPVPDWHGGHLSHAWHRARDAGLFHPWCLRRLSQAWQDEPRLETLDVHERCVALLLCGDAGPALAAAAASDDLRQRLETLAVPVDVLLDAAAPQSYLAHLRQQLQGSRATLDVVAGGLVAALAARYQVA
jgi:pimeloyl-ACP methyl ester carboxylesterase